MRGSREKRSKNGESNDRKWVKKPGPPRFLKCILYIDMKPILYYTSSTIGDDRSSVNRQEGPSFLLIKRLGGGANVYAVVRKLREQEEVKGMTQVPW
jgi:hypothetical protein